ncbi:hypothetical protein ACFWHR_02960 [Leucobacter sp. NPDC058333]|uniref:hypothetical protein n=1 Tax=Leucobacter sp. NPDC058333 TaxID=3346450 RepID=UPI0036460419
MRWLAVRNPRREAGRLSVRTRLAAGIVALGVVAACIAQPPQETEAKWVDAEVGRATFTALTVPTPISTANCVTTPGLLGADPRVTIYWRPPASATGYTSANAEYGYVSGGGLIPVTGPLLGSVATTGTPTAYTTVVGAGLLGGLLGGSIVFGIRFVGPGGWQSSWLVATATMGLAGTNPTCTLSTRPST